jgi:RNA-directed DNA polymerase
MAHARSDWFERPAAFNSAMNPSSLNVLADAFLAGEPSPEKIFERASRVLGGRWPWLPSLARRYAAKFGDRARPRRREVLEFLSEDRGFLAAREKVLNQRSIAEWVAGSPKMWAPGPPSRWKIPAIATAGDLALWAGVAVGELEWLADLKGWNWRADDRRLRHYEYRVAAKRAGGLRLVEAPKPRLKSLQRKVLREILENVPSHNAVHGFTKGRSIRSFAAPQAGRRVVLRMDLQDFFPTIGRPRVQALFRTLGYPESVADLLGGLCTNATPRDIWTRAASTGEQHQIDGLRHFYERPHVPQGAPTSPALANICFYRADCRLTALARSAGAVYTRYADDLAFSGDVAFERRVDRFSAHVGAILLEESFRANYRKTRVMRQGVRQRLAGLAVNAKPNIIRADYDRLKAILTNCARHGAASQNRERRDQFREHLRGRIAFVESVRPEKGRRLREIFARIEWPSS